MKFTKCMACYAGYTDDEKQHLPRKKKKLLKKYLKHVGCYVNSGYYCGGLEFASCTIADDFKKIKSLFKFIPYFKKNKKFIDFILFVANEDNECIIEIEDGDFRFKWRWETDDDFTGGSSGTMSFIYEKSKFNDTWAGSETKNLLEYFGINFESILSDREFIECVSRMSLRRLKVIKEGRIDEFSEPIIFRRMIRSDLSIEESKTIMRDFETFGKRLNNIVGEQIEY